VDRILRFKRHLRVEARGDRVFLLGEREQFLLRGHLYGLVAPLLDGRRTVREVIAALEGKASGAEVYYAVSMLVEKGYVAEATSSLAPEVEAFWQALGVDAKQAALLLAHAPVAIEALGGLDPGPLALALSEVGVSVAPGAPISVVLTPDYLAPELDGWNRSAVSSARPWMLVKPTGVAPWLGPMFKPSLPPGVPARGPCWACLAHRLRANRPVEGFLQRGAGAGGPLATPPVALAGSVRAALDLAALALARWIVRDQEDEALDRGLVALDLATFRISEHAVVRRPQCPVCGDPELLKRRALEPVVLESRPKTFTDDGGYRGVPPEETLRRHEHLVSPFTGVLSSLGPIEGRNHPLRPVFGAAYFIAPAGDDPAFDDFHWMSAGKGRTAAQARASAFCEGIERWSAIFQGDEARVRARLRDLGGEALHPRELLLFSDTQYRDREALSASYGDPKRRIPRPFVEEEAIEWSPAWSLTHARRRYLPTAYCYCRYPEPPETSFCRQDSNGHAAGNSVEEAILQGFLELVERDATALWWYARARRPGVDLASFEEPYFQTLEAHYASIGWRIWVLDLTHDLGIPTFVALGRAVEGGRFCVGFGCHLEARLAVQRALTELNQLFDPRCSLPPPWDHAVVGDQPFLLPDEAAPPRRAADFPRVATLDLRDDVLDCVERAARSGLEVLVIDQTRPDVGLSAVKVIVPGLRHFWPRFAPGRLYDVPVRLGWLGSPLAEAELNPVHIFL
jgi:oxazoline/thiazoline synthase